AVEADRRVDVRPDDLLVLQLRYKKPDGDQPSRLLEYRLNAEALRADRQSDNFKLAAAVAEFGLLLRNSAYKADASYGQALALAGEAGGSDPGGYRAELVGLLEKAAGMSAAAKRGK